MLHNTHTLPAYQPVGAIVRATFKNKIKETHSGSGRKYENTNGNEKNPRDLSETINHIYSGYRISAHVRTHPIVCWFNGHNAFYSKERVFFPCGTRFRLDGEGVAGRNLFTCERQCPLHEFAFRGRRVRVQAFVNSHNRIILSYRSAAPPFFGCMSARRPDVFRGRRNV